MKGMGGPLLCIGDLLSDAGKEDPPVVSRGSHTTLDSQSPHSNPHLDPSHLSMLFQENYDELDKVLACTDKLWTALTLKLCTALETGNKLLEFANTRVCSLSEKVEQLERLTKRTDSAVATAKTNQGPFVEIFIDCESQ